MAFSVSASAWESDVNVNNNTSVVHVQVTITTSGSSYSNYDHYGTIVIDGTSYSHGAYRLPSNTTKTFESSKTVTHNDDGSKSVGWSYSFPVKTNDTRTGSGSLTLTTIARASQPSVSSSSVNLGSAVTINTNRASSSFTHTITYSIGSLSNQTSGLSASTGVGASCTFTPPASLANQFTSSTSGTITITCKTYNGSTLLGTKTCTLTVKTIDNATYRPTISLGVTATNQFNGKYLNKVSGVTITATNSTKYGASVSSYIITGGSKSSSNASLVVNPVNISMSSATQSVTVTGTVTDSRGYKGTGTTSVTIYRYNTPQITAYSIARCNSAGDVLTNGTYAKVGLTYTYQNDGYSNSLSVHKININGTDYTITTTETTANGVVTGTGTAIVGGGSLSINRTYSYSITCTDAVGQTTSVNGVLQTSSRIINVRPGGEGIAFGKFAEQDNLLESAWDIKAPQFNGPLSGTATNATNVNVLSTTLASGTNYYPLFSTGTGNQRARANTNVKLPVLNGTLVVKQSAAITTETNGWYKVNFGAFTLYFKNGSTASQSFGANTWSFINMNLPSGVTYNDAKMLLVGNATGGDNAIRVSFSAFSGKTVMVFSWHNVGNSAVTSYIRYNVGLIVFP